jgi:hypothetical protein
MMETWEIAMFAFLSCAFTLVLLWTLWEIFGRKPPKDVYLGSQRRGLTDTVVRTPKTTGRCENTRSWKGNVAGHLAI